MKSCSTPSALLIAAAFTVSLAALAGCTVMVKSNSAPQAAPAFYLHGRGIAALRAEADRLCPSGYVVTREWQSYEGADRSGNIVKRWFAQAVDWVAPPAFDSAQMDVQCNAPAAPIKSPAAEAIPQS